MPASGQLVCLCKNTERLRESLKKIGGTFEGWLMSSTEKSDSLVEVVTADYGYVYGSGKACTNSVSCIIAY